MSNQSNAADSISPQPVAGADASLHEEGVASATTRPIVPAAGTAPTSASHDIIAAAVAAAITPAMPQLNQEAAPTKVKKGNKGISRKKGGMMLMISKNTKVQPFALLK